MQRVSLEVRPVRPEELERAVPLLERLEQAEEALANLARLARLEEEALQLDEGWGAAVEVDGTCLLVRSDGDRRWSILSTPEQDEADAYLAARRLHALLGEQDEGWDLDR